MPKKIKKRESVNVFGKDIPIEYKAIELNDDDKPFGLYKLEKIIIDEKLKDDELRDTILHEMIHACLDISGLTELLSDEQEEAICCNLEKGLGEYFCL